MRVPAIIRGPGHIPAGVVTNETFAAVDWFPTPAAMAGASKLVPKDRPIDGVDASAFMRQERYHRPRPLYGLRRRRPAGGDRAQIINQEISPEALHSIGHHPARPGRDIAPQVLVCVNAYVTHINRIP